MAYVPRTCLSKNAIDHCMLKVAAEKPFVDANGFGDDRKGDVAVDGDVFWDIVVVEKAKGLQVGELYNFPMSAFCPRNTAVSRIAHVL